MLCGGGVGGMKCCQKGVFFLVVRNMWMMRWSWFVCARVIVDGVVDGEPDIT